MLASRPIYQQSNKIKRQNDLYLPYIVNAVNTLKMSHNDVARLRNELYTGEHSGVRLSASKANSLARINSRNNRNILHKTIRLLNRLKRLGIKNAGNLRALTLVISPDSSKLASEYKAGNVYSIYQDSNGKHPLKQLNLIKSDLNNRLKKYFDTIEAARMQVAGYSLMTNNEYTITSFKALNGATSSKMNQHIHGLLIVPESTNIADLKADLSNVIAKHGKNIHFDMMQVNSDYRSIKEPGETPCIINGGKLKKDTLTNLDKIIAYQNKQVSFPEQSRFMHNDTGQKTKLTQGRILKQLTPKMLAKTVEACANTMYNVNSRQNYGTINQLGKLAHMVMMQFIEYKKHRRAVIQLAAIEEATRLVSQYLASNESRTKPPP